MIKKFSEFLKNKFEKEDEEEQTRASDDGMPEPDESDDQNDPEENGEEQEEQEDKLGKLINGITNENRHSETEWGPPVGNEDVEKND